MATAQEIINSALKRIGVIDAGQSPSTDESNDGLVTLNQMIGSWSSQAAPIWELKREDISLTGAASYALSPRPVKIKSAAVVFTGAMNLPVQVVDAAEWSAFTDKQTEADFAEILWYEEGHPLGTLHLAPKPKTGGELEITSLKSVGEGQIKIRDTLALTGPAFYTIGNGGTLDTQLPNTITGASMKGTGVVSQTVKVLTAEQWSAFPDKGGAGAYIKGLWYDGDLDSPTIYVAPKPASGTLELITYQALSTLGTLGAEVTGPQGYELALLANLAVELAPEYGAPVTQELSALANSSLVALTGLNQATLGSVVPPPPQVPPAA